MKGRITDGKLISEQTGFSKLRLAFAEWSFFYVFVPEDGQTSMHFDQLCKEEVNVMYH